MKTKFEADKKYGKWTALCLTTPPLNVKPKNKYWLCQCECGNICKVRGDTLRRGKSTQCRNCAWDNLKRGEKRGTF